MTELDVVASPGGRSAWATDLMSFGGEPLAITAVLSNTDDIWLVNVVAVAQTPAMRSVRAELKQDAVVPTRTLRTPAPGLAAIHPVSSRCARTR